MEGQELWYSQSLTGFGSSVVVQAERSAKGSHRVPSIGQRGAFLWGFLCLWWLIPPKNEPVLSHGIFQIHSGLFSRGLKQMAHDVSVLFLGEEEHQFGPGEDSPSGCCACSRDPRSPPPVLPAALLGPS